MCPCLVRVPVALASLNKIHRLHYRCTVCATARFICRKTNLSLFTSRCANYTLSTIWIFLFFLYLSAAARVVARSPQNFSSLCLGFRLRTANFLSPVLLSSFCYLPILSLVASLFGRGQNRTESSFHIQSYLLPTPFGHLVVSISPFCIRLGCLCPRPHASPFSLTACALAERRRKANRSILISIQLFALTYGSLIFFFLFNQILRGLRGGARPFLCFCVLFV